MQVTTAGISIPYKNYTEHGKNTSSPGELLTSMCATFILLLGLGIGGLVLAPYVDTALYFLLYPFAILFILTSLMLALTIPIFIRGLHTNLPQLHISHEGIFYPYITMPLLIRWSEITALVPSKMGNIAVLGIVVGDSKAIHTHFLAINAGNKYERTYYSLLVKFEIWWSGSFNLPSPFYLDERFLPVSIDELITAIQEQFYLELREHHITVSG